MWKKIILVSIFGLMASSVSAASAGDLAISFSGKNTFNQNDNVSFNYTITNNSKETINLEYVSYIVCQEQDRGFLVKKTKRLTTGQSETGTQSGFKVNALVAPQSCLAYVTIVAPFNKQAVRPLTINGLEKIKFNLQPAGNLSCPSTKTAFIQSASCTQDKKSVFLKNSSVYLNPMANAGGWGSLKTSAKLYSPSGSVTAVSLPLVFKADRAGNYRLEINASKTGFRSTTQNFYFAVLDNAPVVPNIGDLNQAGVNTINTQINTQSSVQINDSSSLPSVLDRIKSSGLNNSSSQSTVTPSSSSVDSSVDNSQDTIDLEPVFQTIK